MKKTVYNQVKKAITALYGHADVLAFQIETTKDPKHGDYACNFPLIAAKTLGKPPREIAQALVNALNEDKTTADVIARIDIAGPGFMNFTLSPDARYHVIRDILTQTDQFGLSTIGHDQRILLEFVSSNPTGPLHVGHGRSAAIGSSLATLLRAAGFHVDCEYYINDAGRQMEILAISVWLRYLAETQPASFPFPANAYQGDYVITIAKNWQQQVADRDVRDVGVLFSDLPLDEKDGGDKDIYIDALITKARKLLGAASFDAMQAFATKAILDDMKNDLTELGVYFESWFSEKSLFESGALENGIEALKKGGYIEEREGALWFTATQFGDDKDRVVMRANGKPTYFASDVAYHWNKYHRGYTKLINIFGADHHGYIARLKAVAQALGKNPDALEILLVQFAILYRGEERLSMSTRSGSFIPLRQLREEVGNDATRFFYIQRKSDQHMDFDLELAKSQSNDNPVYYIQYAHARICSVFNQMTSKYGAWEPTPACASLSQLISEQELLLIRTLAHYPELVELAALAYEPHQITHYLRDLANHFHTYYNACTFLVDDEALRHARLCLIMAVRQVLRNGLAILGVSAPEHM